MTPTSPEPQTIGDAGEFGLISQITRRLTMPPAVSVGPGDDGAVFLVNGSAVTSVDLLIEGVHFRRDWSAAADVGRKAVAVNVSDIEAMGATPVAMVIGLGAPADLPYSWVKEFMTGVREEADAAGVALVGGDMSNAQQVTISVTVIGETGGRAPVLRSGAKVGQVVAIRGRPGLGGGRAGCAGRGFRSPRAAVDAHPPCRCPTVPDAKPPRRARPR